MPSKDHFHELVLLLHPVGRHLQLAFRLPEPRDVAEHDDTALQIAARVRQRPPVYADVGAPGQSLVPHEHLDVVRRFPAQGAAERQPALRRGRHAVGQEQAVPAAPLVGRGINRPHADDAPRAAVEDGELPVLVGGDHPVAHAVEHDLHRLLLFLQGAGEVPQLMLLLPLPGHVAEDGDPAAHGGPVPIQQRSPADTDVDVGVGRRLDQAQLEIVERFAAQDARRREILRRARGEVVRMAEVVPRVEPVDLPVRRTADDPPSPLVEHQVTPARVEDGNALAHAVEYPFHEIGLLPQTLQRPVPFGLRRLLSRDVADSDRCALHATVGVVERPSVDSEVDPVGPAPAAHEDLGDDRLVAAKGVPQRVVARRQRRALVRLERLVHVGPPIGIGRRRIGAEDVAEGSIHQYEPAAPVDHRHALGREVERAAQEVAAGLQAGDLARRRGGRLPLLLARPGVRGEGCLHAQPELPIVERLQHVAEWIGRPRAVQQRVVRVTDQVHQGQIEPGPEPLRGPDGAGAVVEVDHGQVGLRLGRLVNGLRPAGHRGADRVAERSQPIGQGPRRFRIRADD